MPESYLNRDWESWEKDPSTRNSMHVLTKHAPVDVTLAAAGTAQDLYTIAPGEPTVNIATNPSFETGSPPTGYTDSGSTLTQSGTVARSGTYSASINPDNAAAGEGIYWTSPELGSQRMQADNVQLAVSVYLQDNAGSSDTVKIVIADSSGATLADGNTVTLSAAWQRSTAFYPLTNTGATYRIYIVTVAQHNTTFFADDFQVELLDRSAPTDYCDGTQGVNYSWDGTAHASASRRRKGIVAVRGFSFHTSRDVYIAFDNTATSTTGELVRAGSDISRSGIDFTQNISILNVNAGETPRVFGSVSGIPTE